MFIKFFIVAVLCVGPKNSDGNYSNKILPNFNLLFNTALQFTDIGIYNNQKRKKAGAIRVDF